MSIVIYLCINMRKERFQVRISSNGFSETFFSLFNFHFSIFSFPRQPFFHFSIFTFQFVLVSRQLPLSLFNFHFSILCVSSVSTLFNFQFSIFKSTTAINIVLCYIIREIVIIFVLCFNIISVIQRNYVFLHLYSKKYL
jgi:hypothetical protein